MHVISQDFDSEHLKTKKHWYVVWRVLHRWALRSP
jgi:hypothetical protein